MPLTLTAENRAEIERIRMEWEQSGSMFINDFAQAIFLAGMRAGIEEAAKVCDERSDKFSRVIAGWASTRMQEASQCAHVISALLQPAPQHE